MLIYLRTIPTSTEEVSETKMGKGRHPRLPGIHSWITWVTMPIWLPALAGIIYVLAVLAYSIGETIWQAIF